MGEGCLTTDEGLRANNQLNISRGDSIEQLATNRSRLPTDEQPNFKFGASLCQQRRQSLVMLPGQQFCRCHDRCLKAWWRLSRCVGLLRYGGGCGG